MILYFSGTGNSRFVARRLGDYLNEELCLITQTDPSDVEFTGSDLIFVFPIYSWGIPPVVLDFISRLTDGFCRHVKAAGSRVIMVCTCGDDVAKAPEMFGKAVKERGLDLSGAWGVIMPNNYVLLPGFDVDSKRIEERKLEDSHERIKHISERIRQGIMEIDVVRGSYSGIKSKIIYPLFKRWGIFPSQWHWTSECVGCEKCFAVCPVGNIEMRGGHPFWHDNCVSCLACYHNCPVHAVAYGHSTQHKGQYVCPLHK